uniref:C-type lectin domain-containing protein n=1 Tax=Acrobeloides nanus TaxID=290746 RepID=A0A914EDJ0_9BILA
MNNWLVGGIDDHGDIFGPRYWIGLSTTITGNWTWIDGSNATYRHWGKGYPTPDDGSDQCAVLLVPDATWLSQNCTSNYSFLCKYPPNYAC